MTSIALYSEEDGVVDELLEDLRTQRIVQLTPVGEDQGTQMHFMYKMKNKGKALFKPQRYVITGNYVAHQPEVVWWTQQFVFSIIESKLVSN